VNSDLQNYVQATSILTYEQNTENNTTKNVSKTIASHFRNGIVNSRLTIEPHLPKIMHVHA
jgi:hypothetical protein